MITALKSSLFALVLLTLLTGAIYPLVVTGLGQVLFPFEANGSLVEKDGKVIGSRLIAQSSAGARYFHPRPSAASYDAASSGASNLALSNPALANMMATRTASLARENPGGSSRPPHDLLTASGSGLDPHVSPEAALFQVPRVARARGLAEDRVRALVVAHTSPPLLGIFGASRVNVLELNLALDGAAP